MAVILLNGVKLLVYICETMENHTLQKKMFSSVKKSMVTSFWDTKGVQMLLVNFIDVGHNKL